MTLAPGSSSPELVVVDMSNQREMRERRTQRPTFHDGPCRWLLSGSAFKVPLLAHSIDRRGLAFKPPRERCSSLFVLLEPQ